MGYDPLAGAVVTQQHLEHVHHAALLMIRSLFQGPLECGGYPEVQGFALGVSEAHGLPRKCLCTCVMAQKIDLREALLALSSTVQMGDPDPQATIRALHVSHKTRTSRHLIC